MNVPNNEHYQPSVKTLKKWLKTRKNDFHIGRSKKESLFNQADNSNDTTMLFIVLLFEILGIVATTYAAARGGATWLFISIGMVVLFSLFDFLIATIGLHGKKGDIAYGEAYFPTIDSEDFRTKQYCSENIKKEKKFDFKDFFLVLALVIFAIVKTAAIFWFNAFPLPVIILFTVMYFSIVILHINYTGYAYYLLLTQSAINKESRRASVNPATPIKSLFSTNEELVLPIKINRFEIVKDPNKSNGNHYILKGKGLLTDDDARNLTSITGQSDENTRIIFDACRQVQLEGYGLSSNICTLNREENVN